jgi:hypothetical protein
MTIVYTRTAELAELLNDQTYLDARNADSTDRRNQTHAAQAVVNWSYDISQRVHGILATLTTALDHGADAAPSVHDAEVQLRMVPKSGVKSVAEQFVARLRATLITPTSTHTITAARTTSPHQQGHEAVYETQTGGMEVLRYSHPAYKVHADLITALQEEVLRLGLVPATEVEGVLLRTGILCNRPDGDSRLSVSRRYFQLAIEVLQRRMEAPDDVTNAEKLQMLILVLATHLSVTRVDGPPSNKSDAQDAISHYETLIGQVDAACTDLRASSLLPNLYLPHTLVRQFGRPQYALPQALGLYQNLAALYAHHPQHLEIFARRALFAQQPQTCLDVLRQSASEQTRPLDVLLKQHTNLATLAVGAWFELGQDVEVLALCQALGNATTAAEPLLAEKFLRSLLRTQRKAEARSFIVQHQLTPDHPNAHLAKTVSIALS